MKNLTTKIAAASTATFAFLINSTTTMAAFWADTSIAPAWASTGWFQAWVLTVLNYFLWFLGLLTMIIIVYAGFRMVISQWEDEDFNKAKTQIVYAIIGLVVIILSYSIVRLVTDIQV